MVIYAIIDLLGFSALVLGFRYFKVRLNQVLPENADASKLISDAIFHFLDDINNDPKKAAIVGQFIANASEVAMAKAKGLIPGAQMMDVDLDKMMKKNPMAALMMMGAQAVAPFIIKGVQDARANPGRKGGAGGAGYG